MRKLITPIAAAIAMLTGCNSVPKDPPKNYAAISLSKAQIEQVKIGVAKGLKDPESARFGDAFNASDDGSMIHVCGMVNAKNSYGGYIGEKPFYAAGDKLSKTFMGIGYGGETYRGTDIGTAAVKDMCASKGISPF